MSESDRTGLQPGAARPPVDTAACVGTESPSTLPESEPLALARDGEPTLKRTLSTWDLTSMGVGGIIGAGIFVLTGTAASQYAGPGVILSFIISGFGCAFSALCYSELAAMMPVAGSAYSFATAAFGQLVGFIIGWDLIVEYGFGAATVAVGFSAYLGSLLKDIGLPLPIQIAAAPVAFDHKTDAWTITGGWLNLPAVLCVAACTLLNVYGIQETARFNNVIVLIKLVVLVIFVIAGAFYVDVANYSPFVPAQESIGRYGFTGVLRGSAVVFFSYIGFDAVSASAQEAKTPQTSLPIATIASLLIATALYVAVAAVMVGLAPYGTLNAADPLAVAVDAASELSWLRPIVKVGAVLGLSSVVLVLIMGQVRIFFAMAQDGMLPQALCAVHPRYKTPVLATVLTGVGAAIMAGLLPIDVLGEMVSIGTLCCFIAVCAGVVVLRRRQPHAHRPFRTPYVPWVPLVGGLVAAAQMVALPGGTWWRFLLWLLCGLGVYYFYGRRHARAGGGKGLAALHGGGGGALAQVATSADVALPAARELDPVSGRLAPAPSAGVSDWGASTGATVVGNPLGAAAGAAPRL